MKVQNNDAVDVEGLDCDEQHPCKKFDPGIVNRFKKQKTGISATWSNDDSKEEQDEETTNLDVAFTSKCASDESCDEDISYEELAESYSHLSILQEEICQEGVKQKKIVASMYLENEKSLSTISNLKYKVDVLNSKIDNMSRYVGMLNHESDMLDETLLVDKSNMKGVIIDSLPFKICEASQTEVVFPENNPEFVLSNQMSQHPIRHLEPLVERKLLPWRCHYCERYDHIEPYCCNLCGSSKSQDIYKV